MWKGRAISYNKHTSSWAEAKAGHDCVAATNPLYPLISFVGKNERELTEQKVPYEIGRAYFKDTARAQISGEEVGMLKILFHQDTLEILGIHCLQTHQP